MPCGFVRRPVSSLAVSSAHAPAKIRAEAASELDVTSDQRSRSLKVFNVEADTTPPQSPKQQQPKLPQECCLASAIEESDIPIYDQLGKATFALAVDLLYDKVLIDPMLRPFFLHTDVAALRRKLYSFMAFVLGGAVDPAIVPNIMASHLCLKRYGPISGLHCDRVVQYTADVLTACKVPAALVEKIRTKLIAFRPIFEELERQRAVELAAEARWRPQSLMQSASASHRRSLDGHVATPRPASANHVSDVSCKPA